MYGDVSVIPTRYFLAKPDIGEEFNISLEEGVTLIIKYLATGPLNAHTGKREVFFELNGESRAVGVDDKGAGMFGVWGFLVVDGNSVWKELDQKKTVEREGEI